MKIQKGSWLHVFYASQHDVIIEVFSDRLGSPFPGDYEFRVRVLIDGAFAEECHLSFNSVGVCNYISRPSGCQCVPQTATLSANLLSDLCLMHALDDGSSDWYDPTVNRRYIPAALIIPPGSYACTHKNYTSSGFGSVYCKDCPATGKEVNGTVVW